MGVLKSVELTGFLAFAPAFAGTIWADVNRRIIQNCPHGRGRRLPSPPVWFRLCRLRDQRVAADMVEMKMRVDDEVDLVGITVDRFEPGAHLFAGPKADLEESGEPWTEPPGGVVLAIGVQPGVEQYPPLGMFDKKDRDRQGDVALATLHQTGELTGYRAAGECKELDRHRRLRSAVLADIPWIPLVCNARIAAPSALHNGESGHRDPLLNLRRGALKRLPALAVSEVASIRSLEWRQDYRAFGKEHLLHPRAERCRLWPLAQSPHRCASPYAPCSGARRAAPERRQPSHGGRFTVR